MTALLRRWRTGTDRGHPAEDQLLELVFGAGDSAVAISTARHLRRCVHCTHRARELRRLLDTVAEEAGASFDEAFPPDRLQAQRARIDHRLARVVGAVERARVLSFPFRRTPERQRNLRPSRWAVAATAAGLALGIVAGQLMDFHWGPATIRSPGGVSEAPAAVPVNATLDMAGTIELPPASTADAARAALSLSEFEQVMAETALLDALDVATVSLPVTELASIDALTPRVPDLAAAAR